MSINHLINEDAVPKYDIYTNDITLEEEGKIENAKIKVANNDIVDFSSLASFGAPSERLTSLGNGKLAWVAGSGTSGIEYGGTIPLTLNTLAKYSATDGSIVDKTSFVDTDILLKDGSVAMSGNLDLNNNSLLNAGDISISGNTISSTGFLEFVSGSTERINFKSDSGILSLENNNLGSGVNIELAQFGGTNFNIIKQTGNVDFCAESNDTVEFTTDCFGTNKKVILNPTTATTQLRDYDLDMNSNDITNVSNTTSGVINCLTINSTDAKTNRVFVTGTLDMTTNNINNVNLLDVDNIQSSNPSISFNTPIDMNLNNITRVNDLETSTISAVSSSINMVNNVSLANNNITSVGTITSNVVDAQTTSTLVLNSGINPDLDVNTNLDFDNLYEIKGVTNIQTTDLNTDTLSANAPATEIKLGTNTDLNLDGNSIIGLELINGIQPSGGVYSNPSSNNYAGATAETDILTGTEYGSKTIPADEFVAGSLYSLKIGGEFDATNNDVFTIRVVSNFGLGTEAEFVNIPITITDTNLTNQYFELEIDFAIRTTGGAGVASILTNGSFDYYNTNNLKKGTGINNLNNTTFRTDIDNTLSVTYATTEASVDFTCDIATITKFY
jgi:hypothetical protein